MKIGTATQTHSHPRERGDPGKLVLAPVRKNNFKSSQHGFSQKPVLDFDRRRE